MPLGSSGVPSGPTAIAAAAWSCVEKMLQEAQRTSAPSAFSVSMSTAVWIVMWRLPVIRSPLSGCCAAYSFRTAMRPGISCSARRISLRPHSASLMSATWNSSAPFLVGMAAVVIAFRLLGLALEERLERLGLVGALPAELRLRAAEVSIGGGLLVDRTAEVQ